MARFVFIVSLCSALWGPSLSAMQVGQFNVEPQMLHQHVLLETYLDTVGEPTRLFAYQFGKDIDSNFFYALTIKGAVQGENRGGYGLATMGLGYRQALSELGGWHALASIGSGGGGSIAAQGGLVLQTSLGAYLALQPQLHLELNYGHLIYPYGSFQSNVFSLGIDIISRRYRVETHE